MSSTETASPEKKRDTLDTLRAQLSGEISQQAERLGARHEFLDKLISPKVLIPTAIVTTVALSYAPGVVEGMSRGQDFVDALKYSAINSPLSVIWGTAPEGSVKDTVVMYMLALRSVAWTAFINAGVLTGVLKGVQAAEKRQMNIDAGEAGIKRRKPQILALFGSGTYAGELLFKADPTSIIPIAEEVAAVKNITAGNNHRGFFAHVPDGEYGQERHWRLLRISDKWAIDAPQYGKVLLTVGFGETKDEELPLTEEPFIDLTVEELSIAGEQIQQEATMQKAGINKVITVYIGNAFRKRQRGGGEGLQEMSDIDVAKGTVDIFIDAKTAIVAELMKKLGSTKHFTFDTGVVEYWKGMKQLADGNGLIMHDEQHKDPGDAPILVYERYTDESVQRAKRIQASGKHVIVLTSSYESHKRALDAGLESICVAEILSYKVADVYRSLARGESIEHIQSTVNQIAEP